MSSDSAPAQKSYKKDLPLMSLENFVQPLVTATCMLYVYILKRATNLLLMIITDALSMHVLVTKLLMIGGLVQLLKEKWGDRLTVEGEKKLSIPVLNNL